MAAKKFYITSSIAYTNAPPHIGFALEMIQADVLARYHRLLGDNVFFLTGTDEYGRKVAEAAEAVGKSPKKFCDEISAKFRELTKALNLSNDDFIRTTDQKRHWPAAQKVWISLKENGDIYKKNYEGLYCSGCEAFITKKDLAHGKCVIHQKEPEAIKEENYFFRLSKYSKEIEKIIEKDKIRIVPQTRKNEMLNFVKQGLEDISFSRPRKDLKWGIPVPVPDDDTQTIYVWAEALVNYLSAIDYFKESKKFKIFWPADIHCVGKDILKFHAIFFLGMILSLGLKLPKTIFVHGFITVAGQKMSKSLGNIIDPFELVKKYGTDPVRYFLLREIPSTEDGDFTYEKFEERYNADLSKGLGNLVARIIRLAEKFNVKKTANEDDLEHKTTHGTSLKTTLDAARGHRNDALDEFKFNEALFAIWQLISFCDFYIEEERPWEGKKEKVIGDLLFILEEIARLLEPFLPETSEKISKQIKAKKGKSLFPRL